MSLIHQVWPKPSCKAQWKGGRRRGRQRERWEDNIREWTGLEFAKSQRALENREEWRKLVAKSSMVPQWPSWLRDRWDETGWKCLHSEVNFRTMKHAAPENNPQNVILGHACLSVWLTGSPTMRLMCKMQNLVCMTSDTGKCCSDTAAATAHFQRQGQYWMWYSVSDSLLVIDGCEHTLYASLKQWNCPGFCCNKL